VYRRCSGDEVDTLYRRSRHQFTSASPGRTFWDSEDPPAWSTTKFAHVDTDVRVARQRALAVSGITYAEILEREPVHSFRRHRVVAYDIRVRPETHPDWTASRSCS